jgi:uncharacterized membrane protein
MNASASAAIADDRATRWVLFVSLALNLFFVGIAGALLIRHYTGTASIASTAPLDRSAAARIERLAATLPTNDADILRSEFRARAPMVETAREDYRRLLEVTRTILRTEPFDVEAMRSALAAARVARQTFDQRLHEVIAAAAAKMSAEGRSKLADWSSTARSVTETNR